MELNKLQKPVEKHRLWQKFSYCTMADNPECYVDLYWIIFVFNKDHWEKDLAKWEKPK